MESEILYSRKEREGAAWAEITLNRPQKGNALTLPMLNELESHIAGIRTDATLRAVVLRGNGRFFCTGGDIEAWGALSPNEMGQNWILRGIEVFDQIASLPQPVIAAISGHALGGGLELALAADLRAGVKMLGSLITAEQALDWGLLTALADDAVGLEQQINQWLDRLLSNGPIAMSLTKGLLKTIHVDMRHAHASAAAHAAATEDCTEGVRAFTEKRKPVFRNR